MQILINYFFTMGKIWLKLSMMLFILSHILMVLRTSINEIKLKSVEDLEWLGRNFMIRENDKESHYR